MTTKFQFVSDLGKNPQFISLVTDTEPDLITPKSNKFAGLRKISYRTGILNFVYERSVQAQLKREGKDPELYISGGRRNGLEYVGESKCLMFHPNKEGFYLWFKQEKNLQTEYVFNGQIIDPKDLVGWLREKSSPSTQDDIEKKIFGINIKFENIISITANGQIYY